MLLISTQGLAGTGLVTPESLVDYTYRIALTSNAGGARRIDGFKADARKPHFPTPAGRSATAPTPRPASAALSNRSRMFLTLVGLTALGVGGVGAGQAMSRLPGPQARRHRHPENAGRGRAAWCFWFSSCR